MPSGDMFDSLVTQDLASLNVTAFPAQSVSRFIYDTTLMRDRDRARHRRSRRSN